MYNNVRMIFFVIIIALLMPENGNAQGISVSWDTDFPQPGTKKGSINVEGSINIPGGVAGSTVGTGRIILIPVGGGQKITVNFNLPAKQTGVVAWSASASMLNGNNYNVIVEIDVQITPKFASIYATDPGKSAPR